MSGRVAVTAGLLAAIAMVSMAATIPKPAKNAKLLRTKVELAAKVYALTKARFDSGLASSESVALWSRRWFDAERETDRGPAPARALLDRALDLERNAKRMAAGGLAHADAALAAAYFRADAELEAARASK